jgi:hypothetical protein
VAVASIVSHLESIRTVVVGLNSHAVDFLRDRSQLSGRHVDVSQRCGVSLCACDRFGRNSNAAWVRVLPSPSSQMSKYSLCASDGFSHTRPSSARLLFALELNDTSLNPCQVFAVVPGSPASIVDTVLK